MKIYIIMRNNSKINVTDKALQEYQFVGATKYVKDAQQFCAEHNDHLRNKRPWLKDRDIRGYGNYYFFETNSEDVNVKIDSNVCIEYQFGYDLDTGKRFYSIEIGYTLIEKTVYKLQPDKNRLLLVFSVDANIPLSAVKEIADSMANKTLKEKGFIF